MPRKPSTQAPEAITDRFRSFGRGGGESRDVGLGLRVGVRASHGQGGNTSSNPGRTLHVARMAYGSGPLKYLERKAQSSDGTSHDFSSLQLKGIRSKGSG